MDFDSHDRYQDFETGVLHRILSRVHLAEWFGPGSHSGKKYCVASISHNHVAHVWKNKHQEMVSAPNVPRGPKGHDYNICLAWNGLTAPKYIL